MNRLFALVSIVGVHVAVHGAALAQPPDNEQDKPEPAEAPVQLDPIAKYFNVLEAMKLVDVQIKRPALL